MNSKSRKILFVIESLNIGGAEKALLTLLHSIEKDPDLEITLLIISYSGGFITELSKLSNIKVRYIVKPTKSLIKTTINKFKIKLLYSWLPSSWVGKYISRGFEIVIAFSEGFITKWLAEAPNKIKKIAWVHTDMVDNNWPLKTGIFKTLKQEQVAYKKFNKVIGVSRNVSNGIRILFNISNVSTIYNLLDDEILEKGNAFPVTYDKEKINLVSVGRLERVKGYDRLIEVIADLINELRLPLTLTIVGDGSEKRFLEEKLLNYNLKDHVFLAGFKENPYPFLKQADIFICPSRKEGFNIAIVEAMKFGLPIIATNCAGPSEIIGNNEFGYLVENNKQGLKKGIIKFIHSPSLKQEFKGKSLTRSEYFSNETNFSDFYEIIQTTIHGKT